ncbi:MAG: hypothetical protein A2142_01255 [candidate division Zixibacteria bacterium RBG_16_48_11]|nr:MAG: hypothetical protein A2142_01255 [candidate division Zixibacteria bacterium RBG_16_48_11]
MNSDKLKQFMSSPRWELFIFSLFFDSSNLRKIRFFASFDSALFEPEPQSRRQDRLLRMTKKGSMSF